MPACCQNDQRPAPGTASPPGAGVHRTRLRGIVTGFKLAIPSIVLALLPKCPACFAAYVACATGLGLSFAAARVLRSAIIVLCAAVLAILAMQLFFRCALVLHSQKKNAG